MSQFETGILTRDENVEASDRLNAAWVDRAMTRTAHRRVIFDMDSSESPVHGGQEGASYNGHFGSTCYHPLFVFNQFGDCEGAMLRSGNVHSAHRWRDVLDPILSRYGSTGVRRYFRADAAFAKPDIYEYLEERRVFYAIRLPSNKVLQHEIAPLLIRPVGRPPKRPVILYDAFWYRAGSWYRARRVVAKVEWHRGKLFPRVGFIVTNMTAGPEGVVRFYNGRGTAEQWIKEGKYALNWTRLSCHRFVANRVRLSLFILAYNLGNFLRRLCLPKAVRVQPRSSQEESPVFNALSSINRGPGDNKSGQRVWFCDGNRTPYRTDRALTGFEVHDYAAAISFGMPYEPEDSQYGKYFEQCHPGLVSSPMSHMH